MVRLRRKTRRQLIVGGVAALALGGGALAMRWQPRAQPRRLVTVPFKGPQINCDVMVVGGTPSGVAAAIAAARRGAKVVLIEERARLGGDAVYAMLNMFDVPMHRDGTSPVAQGVFGEFFSKLGIGFDIVEARKTFEAKVRAEPNIRVMLRTKLLRALRHGPVGRVSVVGARVKSLATPNARAMQINARCVVDATNDANFAMLAGAHAWTGRQQSGLDKKMQSAGLLFAVDGVNWRKMVAYTRTYKRMPSQKSVAKSIARGVQPSSALVHQGALKNTKLSHTDVHIPGKGLVRRLGGGAGNYLWERGDVIKSYVPRGPNVEILSINFGRQHDGSVVLNTINAINVNGLDWHSKLRARREMTQELRSFLPYLRLKMPGMKNAKLKLIAPELYIRETRHVQGFYTLRVSDIKKQRNFPDAVARVSYPIDLHPYAIGDKNPYGPKRYFYTLPLRALVPRAVDGVFIASRSLSATYDAAGSARVIPITMAAGQACGLAAWLCATENSSPHEMARKSSWWPRLQDEIHRDGLSTEAQLESEEIEPTPRPRRR